MKKNRPDDNDRHKARVIPMDAAFRRSGRKPPEKPLRQKPLRRKTESIEEYKRGKSIKRSTTAVAVLFFVTVFIYLIQTLVNFFTTPDIPVDMVRLGSIETPVTIEGIIIRDETVYTAPWDGVVQFSVNHYDRVRPGTEVASIQNLYAVNNIRHSIYQVEEQIINLQEIRGDLSAVDPAVHMINGRIQNMVDSRLSRHINLNMNEVYSLRDNIVQNVNLRNQMIVTETLEANVRAGLGIQHGVLMGELDANRTPIHINGGGIVSPLVDGLESQLTFQSMYYLDRDQTQQSVDFNQIIPMQQVGYGDYVFKIVNSNHWYIAAHIPSELAGNMSEGATTFLYIEGRPEPLRVRVHYTGARFQEVFVIFRSTEYMSDFLNTRNILFRTTDTIQHGLRIANTAITHQQYLALPIEVVHGAEEERYVVRAMGEEDLHIPIVVEYQDNYIALAAMDLDFLTLGSILREREEPTNTRILNDYRLIQGVFRVNNGIAVFVPINIQEDAPVGSVYTILDPALNPGIRVYDHIVIDASVVQVGDIVFSGVR